MSESKNQQIPHQAKQPIQTAPPSPQKVQVKSETAPSDRQGTQKVQNQTKIIGRQKLELVLYQVAKPQSSVLKDEEKYPIMLSFTGVFLTFFSATLANIAQIMFKPELKKKKLFFYFGAGNILAGSFLIGYSVYHMSKLYVKIPEQKWLEIEKEKKNYDKMSFKEKRTYFAEQLQRENNKKTQNQQTLNYPKNQKLQIAS